MVRRRITVVSRIPVGRRSQRRRADLDGAGLAADGDAAGHCASPQWSRPPSPAPSRRPPPGRSRARQRQGRIHVPVQMGRRIQTGLRPPWPPTTRRSPCRRQRTWASASCSAVRMPVVRTSSSGVEGPPGLREVAVRVGDPLHALAEEGRRGVPGGRFVRGLMTPSHRARSCGGRPSESSLPDGAGPRRTRWLSRSGSPRTRRPPLQSRAPFGEFRRILRASLTSFTPSGRPLRAASGGH